MKTTLSILSYTELNANSVMTVCIYISFGIFILAYSGFNNCILFGSLKFCLEII